MFEALKAQPADKILTLMQAFREDPRPGKIDLGVGVYKNAEGVTPVMRAVKAAERRLVEEQTTKTYVGLLGDPAYSDAMIDLVLAGAVPKEAVAAAATPGGTGAVRQAFELIQYGNPDARIFVSDPTWPNHTSILNYLKIPTVSYRYFDAETGGVNFDGMLEDIAQAQPGDVILLHGCCHNPTGANLTLDQWEKVARLLVERDLFPFVDLAYQGFGDGLDTDAAPVRLLAKTVPEMAIATSCSKNFSVYRDRVGAMMLLCKDADSVKIAGSQALMATRVMYSMPPDHAAAAVRIILEDEALTANWRMELEEMRLRMLNLRKGFADALRRHSNSDRFDFIAEHRGMFSRLGITEAQVDRLREEFGIYMVGDSRFNVAGLKEDRLEDLAKAVVSVL